MADAVWTVTDSQYLDAPGVSILSFHNSYPQGKQGGVEIIHHGERVASCGMLRVRPTSGSRALANLAGDREVDAGGPALRTPVDFGDFGIGHTVTLRAEGEAVRLTLELAEPLDGEALSDAQFALELYPPAYWGRTFHVGGAAGVFPRDADGRASLAKGRRLVLASEEPERRMTIEGVGCELELVDGRRFHEETWFLVRTPVEPGACGKVVEWLITPHRVPGWRRRPVLCLSQVGYHPDQAKRLVIELDPRWDEDGEARLLRVEPGADPVEVASARPEPWGRFLRYDYAVFDFTQVRQPGAYVVEYAGESAGPFRIDPAVYREGVWQPTLATFFPVQMCHMSVWDHGHLWHAACHVDDALQAPAPTEHFDGYRQGETTDTEFAPYEHIPHLDVGGWHDAGDTDLAAGSQASTVYMLALAHQEFGLDLDETTVRFDERLALLHEPDGVPDVLHQVAHGAECLLGGYRASGHSYCGIIAGDVRRYHQRGELSTMTDNLVYDPALAEDERTGTTSGLRDDRWAFTNRDTSLQYAVAAALAAASTVLRGHDEELADECLRTAIRAWEHEQAHEPVRHRMGYVPGHPEGRELVATAELLMTTGEERFRKRLVELTPVLEEAGVRVAWAAARALPKVEDEGFAGATRDAAERAAEHLAEELAKNPFRVPWHPHIWGIGWNIQYYAFAQYFLARAYPDLFDRENVLAVVDYVLGCHPGSNVSLVSGVGVRSLTVAFGINRADWHYISGGMASGTALIRPDFPELKEGFPFLWQQSEYVMPGAGSYIFCVLAADALLNAPER